MFEGDIQLVDMIYHTINLILLWELWIWKVS